MPYDIFVIDCAVYETLSFQKEDVSTRVTCQIHSTFQIFSVVHPVTSNRFDLRL